MPSCFGAADTGGDLGVFGLGLSALLGGDIGRSLDSRGLDSRERDAAPPNPLNPPRLKPSPAGLALGCRGAGGRGLVENESGRAGD